jgi:hypothetical protein
MCHFRVTLWPPTGPLSGTYKYLICNGNLVSGGERGIRTPDRALRPYNGLANRRLQPLGHLSAVSDLRHGVCAPTP